MKAISGRDFARLLEPNGWELKRINSSHHMLPNYGYYG